MEQASLATWFAYYIIGLVGIYLHIMADSTSANPLTWIKDRPKEFVVSLVAFNVILFLWYSEGVSFFGMPMGQPNGLTLMVGYMVNSLLKNLMTAMAKKAGVEDAPKP